MPEITNFEHNGVDVQFTKSPESLGALGGHVVGLVGTAPDKDAAIAFNTPYRIASLSDAAKLDVAGHEAGSLYHCVYETLKKTSVVIYVVVVPEAKKEDGAFDQMATMNNIIGGVEAGTDRLTGLRLLSTCAEVPTMIACPGYSHMDGLRSEMAAIAQRMMALVVLDAPDVATTDVVNYSKSVGGAGLGYEAAYVAYPMPKIYSKAAKGDIAVAPSVLAVGAMAAKKPWESPGNQGVNATDMTRVVNYNILDRTTDGDLLNRYGISYFARTTMGGYSLIGNRSLMGEFISHVGLRYAIARKLVKAAQKAMAEQLTKSFMEQQVKGISDWGQTLVADQVVPVFECYLHPELNTLENYKNGKWYIVLNYGQYSPNETMVYTINADDSLTAKFLEGVLNG